MQILSNLDDVELWFSLLMHMTYMSFFPHSFSNRVVAKSSLQRSRSQLEEWLLELGTVRE
jgi:hypothetical protein